MNLNADTFWQYSLEIYGRDGVSEQALLLQDEFQVNVNMLLLLCWCLDNGMIVTLNQWQVLHAAIADTDTQLASHRVKRRDAKAASPFNQKAYEALKQEELAIEMQQQEALTTMFNRLTVESVPVKGINGSVAGFVNLFKLRQQPAAVKRITAVIQSLQAGQ